MENEFPVRLRRQRERLNRKQYAVAQCCGIDRTTLRRYEKGEVEPLLTQLIELADYFDVSIDFLAGRTNNPQINR